MEQPITERDIQRGLYAHLYFKGWRMFLPNVRMYDWESDYLTFNLDGQVHEFEIKITRSDFLADLCKPKHTRLRDGRFSNSRIPNYFTFVLPAGVGRRYEVPEYAGVMEWTIERGKVKITPIRTASEITPIRCCEQDFAWFIEKSNEKMVRLWQ